MRKQLNNILFFTIIMLISFSLNAQVKYPRTKKTSQKDIYFGVKVKDPYRWLEDDKSPNTEKWVQDQNKATNKYLSQIPYRDSIKHTLTSMWNYEKYGLPIVCNNYIVYSKNTGLQNQSIIYKRIIGSNEEQVLIDPNKFSKEGTAAISNISIQKEGKYIAYCVALNGSDWNEIRIVDENGVQIKERIRNVKFSSIAWKDEGFYYSRYENSDKSNNSLTATNENQIVFYHKIGSQMEDDLRIFRDPEHPRRTFSMATTDDERFLIMSVTESTTGNAIFYRNTGSDNQDFTPLINEFGNDYHIIGNYEDDLIFVTNDNAVKYKIVKYNTSQKAWADLIPENEEGVIQSATLVGDKIYVSYMMNAVSNLIVYDSRGILNTKVRLPGIGTIGGISGKKDNPNSYFTFNTFTSPTTIYSLNQGSENPEVFMKQLTSINEDEFITEQVFYPSKDGQVKIPMFIVRKKNTQLDGNNPLMLYGYGGFNISLTPSFSISRMLFLENGGIYAVANIRGGGEYGKKWHEQGTVLKKQNTFDDFIAAAEYLIKNKYTCSQKLAISGGSNGGLLVGACMTQRPELFRVALPAVGVLDMLRYHKFTIGWSWRTDYGTSDTKDEFNYIYKYSPLHNIKKRTLYPATLVTTADHDDRVVPAHSFKFIATLQKKAKHIHPSIIRIETNAGHGAGKPTSKAIDEAADIWSFTFFNLGMKFDANSYR